MKEKKFKTYQVNEKTYVFNHSKFTVLCSERSRRYGTRKSSQNFLANLEVAMDSIVSSSTIKGWIYGSNSPSTIDIVERLAKVFGLDKFDLLLETEGKDKKMNNTIQCDEKTRDIVAGLYEAFSDSIEEFRQTSGFTFAYLNGNEMFAKLEWEEKRSDLSKKIRSCRVYLKKDIVMQLQGLNDIIFMSLNDYWCTDSLFSTDSIGKAISYEEFLDGQKDDSFMKEMFVDYLSDGFYEQLDEILADYLP